MGTLWLGGRFSVAMLWSTATQMWSASSWTLDITKKGVLINFIHHVQQSPLLLLYNYVHYFIIEIIFSSAHHTKHLWLKFSILSPLYTGI